MAYVYGLRTSHDLDYFYIGSTKNSLSHRLKQHIDYIRLGYNKNHHLVNKVRKVGFENVIIEPIIECDESERFDREYEIITEHLQKGVHLTNVVVNYEYDVLRQAQEYDEFQLEPHHIEAFADILEAGAKRNGDPLHDRLSDLLEDGVLHMARKHTADFLNMIAEIMTDNYEPVEANRKTAELHKRVLAALERHEGGD